MTDKIEECIVVWGEGYCEEHLDTGKSSTDYCEYYVDEIHEYTHYLLGFLYEHLKDKISEPKQQYIDFNCKFCKEEKE